MTFGDPRYMSPEQARGDRIDRRADIYQLGCVAYEMLTGAPPFTGSRVFDILTKQVTEAPAPLPTRRPGVPLWMEAAVTKMLAKDPENRFATTTRMVEALRRGLETGEVMEDEIARRRESIPPPSVSRVMQQDGDRAPIDRPPSATSTGTATVRGHCADLDAAVRSRAGGAAAVPQPSRRCVAADVPSRSTTRGGADDGGRVGAVPAAGRRRAAGGAGGSRSVGRRTEPFSSVQTRQGIGVRRRRTRRAAAQAHRTPPSAYR